MNALTEWFRAWAHQASPMMQILLILIIAAVIQRLAKRIIGRLATEYAIPRPIAFSVRRGVNFFISIAAGLAILERLGVSGESLWTAFTGFAAVAAVAFFAAWSVLSNIFCSVLILTTRPFRLLDYIEVLENGEKPGLRGRVVDINLIYSTLEDYTGAEGGGERTLQIPNSLFFQRTVRRWKGTEPPAHWVK